MEETNEKRCPHCGSPNVEDTGNRNGADFDFNKTKDIPEPPYPIYRCKEKNCGKEFLYLGD